MNSYNSLFKELQYQFSLRAETERAQQKQAYMKCAMPFWGLIKPEIDIITKTLLAQYMPKSNEEYRQTISYMFSQSTHREEWYATLNYARHHKKYIVPENIDIYLDIVLKSQWWDIVDTVADHLVGKALFKCPDRKSVLLQLIKHENMWMRRTAIIAQLKYKLSTDFELLGILIKETAHEKEFFIKKAIGWALREYSKINQLWVRSFIDENKNLLQPLSIREGSKYILIN
jgi:3-methyladenine DNA glycosylase AlkD